MDPLGITANAVALAVSIIRSALAVKDAVDQFRDAPAVARDIEYEVNIVQASLRQVEAALLRDTQAIGRLRLGDIFELSVEGCRDTLQQIDQEFKTLLGRHDWKLRVAVWWNAGEIGRLLARLERKKGSLMLLVQALNLHSVQELQDLLQQNMRTLDLARLGLEDMVPSYPAHKTHELDTMASAIGSVDTLLGDRDSVRSSTRFIFDDICFDSKPYRHAVARTSAAKSRRKKRTTVAATSDTATLSPVKEATTEANGEVLSKAPLPTSPMAVAPEEHEAVVMRLREAEALIQALQQRMSNASSPVAQDGRTLFTFRSGNLKERPTEDKASETCSVDAKKQTRVEDCGVPGKTPEIAEALYTSVANPESDAQPNGGTPPSTSATYAAPKRFSHNLSRYKADFLVKWLRTCTSAEEQMAEFGHAPPVELDGQAPDTTDHPHTIPNQATTRIKSGNRVDCPATHSSRVSAESSDLKQDWIEQPHPSPVRARRSPRKKKHKQDDGLGTRAPTYAHDPQPKTAATATNTTTDPAIPSHIPSSVLDMKEVNGRPNPRNTSSNPPRPLSMKQKRISFMRTASHPLGAVATRLPLLVR